MPAILKLIYMNFYEINEVHEVDIEKACSDQLFDKIISQ